MKITVLTLFPDIFKPVLETSILGRAVKKGLIEYHMVDLRQFGEGIHQIVDDRPYGGGVGMVFKADVLARALQSLKRFDRKIDKQSFSTSSSERSESKVILMSAAGVKYTQAKAQEYSQIEHLIIICGHYEGVDQRFIDKYVDEEISIGDYVLTGGEIPAMVVIDSVTRLIPKVLEKVEATQFESFSDPHLLEHPHYTRPEIFEDQSVPKVLLSGNHQEIQKWRDQQAEIKTKKNRPDLVLKRKAR